MTQPINGGRPKPALPRMKPEERELWMASRNAPEGARLVYEDELDGIMQALNAEHNQRVTHDVGTQVLRALLAGWFVSEPDLANAVAACAKDASKYKKAVDLAEKKIAALKETADKVAASIGAREPAAAVDLVNLGMELAALLKLFEKARIERHDRGTIKKVWDQMAAQHGLAERIQANAVRAATAKKGDEPKAPDSPSAPTQP